MTTEPSSRFSIWVQAMRLRTLPAAIVPVLVGTAVASAITATRSTR